MKRLTCVLVLVMSCLCLFATHRPVVALVLSGGGARGFAHIPIIEELERRGIVPDMVIGASMGALVGALYASGYTSQDMYALIDDTDFMNAVFNLSQPAEKVLDRAYDSIGDPNFSIDFTEGGIGRTDALLDDSKVNLILHESLSRVEDIGSFDDLAIPFRCVGTDFRSGEGIVFSSGSLYDALRASMSMPRGWKKALFFSSSSRQLFSRFLAPLRTKLLGAATSQRTMHWKMGFSSMDL